MIEKKYVDGNKKLRKDEKKKQKKEENVNEKRIEWQTT